MASSMSVKTGTKTWSDAKAPETETSVPSLSLKDKEKIGDSDLKAVLNKAADKNWVDDRKRVAGHGNSAMDKDAFFKLMLAQLKNQDPMNPLKNHEMAAQLAQFSSLEQMTNVNTTLTKLEGKMTQPENFQALNLIGKTVAGDSARVSRTQFDKEHDFNFNLPQDAAEATVKLLSAKGELVREYKMNELKMGANKISWNGTNEGGVKQPPGEYVFQIEAVNHQGSKIHVNTEFKGEITGLSFSAEGPVLQVGNQNIKMKDIGQITDSSAKPVGQNLQNQPSLDLKNNGEVTQTNNKNVADTSSNALAMQKQNGASDVMTQVAMSRGLMDKLQKEMK